MTVLEQSRTRDENDGYTDSGLKSQDHFGGKLPFRDHRNGVVVKDKPESVKAVLENDLDGAQRASNAVNTVIHSYKDTRAKKEEKDATELSTIPEDVPGLPRPESKVYNGAAIESIRRPSPTWLQAQSKQPGLPPSMSGSQQQRNGLGTVAKGEGVQSGTSKEEESSDINLHEIPVYQPHPKQPSPSVLTDPFVPARPAKTRRESDIPHRSRNLTIEVEKANTGVPLISPVSRPATGLRTLSTPNHIRSSELSSGLEHKNLALKQRSEQVKSQPSHHVNVSATSPIPPPTPLPPLSLPTYLQLELFSHRHSPTQVYRSSSSEFPYESSRVKIERLLNFLFLPYELEGVLWFGALACLDYWLYTFTILPLRLLKSLYILCTSWTHNVITEVRFVGAFVYNGSKRMWQRRHVKPSKLRNPLSRANSESKFIEEKLLRAKSRPMRQHKRARSAPSTLLPDDKADILKSLLIIFTCLILLKLDASRMYHWVRGQAAIKLYVIYNVLEVFDRLLSAIGQDVLECLFSQETLERKPDGHSKILRPFWLFVLALIYTVIHSTALFYQVVTLNVAVNSYSNALVTLLMSNQFVEIKGTVFKKFEKENLFQLTCADIVERFQLWHMLIIIASRNIAETGGWNIGLGNLSPPSPTAVFSAFTANATSPPSPPRSVIAILPQSFTLLPSLVSWLSSSIPTVSQVMGPFVIVLGSEMLIDWLKHAYIGKFNNVRPVIYSRFLDVLAKDYYTNAFGDQNLTKRLGLPVIPLSCLLIRAGVQTYQMFVAAWMPAPSPSAAASLASIHQHYTASRNAMPTSTAAIIAGKVDDLLYHIPSRIANSEFQSHITTILVVLLIYLVLLACKLILGMLLLAYSRARFTSMKEREKGSGHHVEGGRRVGGWGVVEVDEDKRRRIYEDDPTGLRNIRDREAKDHVKREQAKERGGGLDSLDKVKRYDMVAKRIW